MKLEIHMIQAAGPSAFNLGRQGELKGTVMGNTRRVRVSEQSQTARIRALQTAQKSDDNDLLKSRVLAKELESLLGNRKGCGVRIRAVFDLFGVNVNMVSKTQERLAFQLTELKALARFIEKHWDILGSEEEAPESLLKELETAIPTAIGDELAVHGRFMAIMARLNKLKALRFADAVSVHAAPFELDALTAGDDLGAKYHVGPALLSYRPFASATYYRYAMLDCDRLKSNLTNKSRVREVTANTLHSVLTAPFGSRVAADAQQPPLFFVLVCAVKRGAPFNYSYAFARNPPTTTHDFASFAVSRLAKAWKDTEARYGTFREVESFCNGEVVPAVFKKPDIEIESLPALVDKVVAQL